MLNNKWYERIYKSVIYYRLLRQKLCKKKRKYQGGQKFDTTNISVIVSQDTNNTKEDNTDYQELGQISGPSLYDKIYE